MIKLILFILSSSMLFLSFDNVVLVTDFLPDSYVKDGSVSYQKEIQKAIDKAAESGAEIIFPPMVYSIDESGIKIRSNMILSMYGAVFNLNESCKNDGFAFWGENITNVQFRGGEIVGHNDVWGEGINIRGIYITGKSSNIRCSDMYIHDLSSNGIGIFGEPEHNVRDIWVTNVIIENSSNYYGDYMSERPGIEPGSNREDQGLVALYYCEDFYVSGCRFDKSRSDGTHFYKCKNGQFVNNKVYSSQMGGYFLETCLDVVASGNIIKQNGSRGTTIERGSKRCTLVDNIVANSGREGLWAPRCEGLIITGNIFDQNGRKPLGSKPNQLWNANITINEAPTNNYLIQGNIIYTNDYQHAAIYIDTDKSSNIVVKGNILRGNNRLILITGENRKNIVIQDNFLDKINVHYERMYEQGLNKNNVFINDATVEINSKQKNMEVRYTTDGTEPTQNSLLCTEPFTVTETTSLKIRIFTPDSHSPVYEVHYEKENPREPLSVNTKNKGLNFEYFEFAEHMSSVTELQNLEPTKKGHVSKFVYPYEDEKFPEQFGLIYKGYIKVSEEDVYRFSVTSNDGSRLYVADKLVVNNDGLHGAYEKEGEIALQKGWHKIELLYFQAGGGKALKVFMKNSQTKKAEIWESILLY